MTSSKVSRPATWLLIVLTALMALNHVIGVFGIAESSDERLMFVCFAALNLLSLIVLLGPVRRGEQWAWAASWIQVVATALVMLIGDGNAIGYSYLSIAVVMALCLLIARPSAAR